MGIKKFTAVLAAALMVIAPSNAFASQEEVYDIGIQLNGEALDLSGEQPVIRNNRVFLPLRPVFEGIGADVTYDENEEVIVAEKDGKTVEITVGSRMLKVTEGATTESVATDAASFVEDGRAYIPVRFAAQAFGCDVGWDNENMTVIIVDKNTLKGDGGTYNIINNYLKQNIAFSYKNYALTGTADISISVNDGTIALPIEGVYETNGLVDRTKINMDTVLKLDLSAVKELLGKELENPLSAGLVEQFENIPINFIFDMTTGSFYVQSSLLSSLMGASGDTWYYLNFDALMEASGIKFSQLVQDAYNMDDFTPYADMLLENIPMDNKYENETAVLTYNMINGLYSDNSFTEEDGFYVTSFEESLYGINTSYTLSFPTDPSGADYGFTFSSYPDGRKDEEFMSMEMSQEGLVSSFEITMDFGEAYNMSINGSITYSETDETPVIAPAPGSNVISVNEMMGLTAMP